MKYFRDIVLLLIYAASIVFAGWALWTHGHIVWSVIVVLVMAGSITMKDGPSVNV